jgi:hypothetical protein
VLQPTPAYPEPVHRRVIILVVGAAVLGLVVTVVAVVGFILPRLRPAPEPHPTFAPGELTPEESTVLARPQPDGTVRVEQVLIFDVVPGLEGDPAAWYLGGTRIGWKSAERTAQYGVIPKVVALEAREIPAAADPVPLKITADDDKNLKDPFFDGRHYRLIAPAPWSLGRHRVEFSYVLTDVWVVADGVRALVLPLQFARGPGNGQPQDLVRLRVRGAAGMQCPPTNVTFAERRKCGYDQLTYRAGDLDQVQAVAVPEPVGVTAEPVPVTEKSR